MTDKYQLWIAGEWKLRDPDHPDGGSKPPSGESAFGIFGGNSQPISINSIRASL